MRNIAFIACAALTCLGSKPLLGQDQPTSVARPVDDARKNVRDIADSLRGKPVDVDTTVPKGWRPPRTSWGDPDIDGVYTNNDEWGIPFERPAEFEGRRSESMTAEELARIRNVQRERLLERLATQAPAEPGTIGWYDTLNARNSRAWLIVDPDDGHIPSLTSGGRRRADAAVEAESRPRAMNSYADRSLYERCISRGLPGSMIPETYGNAYQIHQSPGTIAIRYEQIHETRIIPLGTVPHVGKQIRSYMGDGRGYWDADTLVVEATNFRDNMRLSSSASRLAFRGFDPTTLRLVERFRPIGPRTVEWSVRVEDPSTWTRPWTFAMHLTKVDASQQPYEYACHEGNYGIRNGLSIARAAEKEGH